jgi:hypothetical protein
MPLLSRRSTSHSMAAQPLATYRGFESLPLRQLLGFQLISALVERHEKAL